MTTSHKLTRELTDYISQHRIEALRFLHHFSDLDRPFLLRSELLDEFKALNADVENENLKETPLAEALGYSQEAAIGHGFMCFALRLRVARWLYLNLHMETLDLQEIDVAEYLRFKERLATGDDFDPWALEIDLEPFSREFYKLREASSIGQGVLFLNRRLSSSMFEDLHKGDRKLLEFLRVHRYREQQLMLNDAITDVNELREALRHADSLLAQLDPAVPWRDISHDMRNLGFEPGWGDTASRVRNTIQLLLDILQAPSPTALEDFLGRVPMIFSIAILSIHGWFGQSDVLGRPDTGGQVVYILDQVRALEAEMRKRLAEQGLEIEPRVLILTRLIPDAEGTTCNQRLEPVSGTHNAVILRVPFRDATGRVIPHWISRFDIWPYLERYTLDAETELLAELGGRPDLLVGNYSDGNLVASLMSQRMGVTQCNIAHALEKTKYLYSDLFWKENENQYHFSCQFTADLIAMNSADFIITSTYQEIAGTADGQGQYESYMNFTMPDLYRVVQGTDVYDPKFNIVSPGADPDVYFPYKNHEERLLHLHHDIEDLIYGQHTAQDIRGVLVNRDKPLLFSMARLDRIKNITGLVEWYGNSPELQEQVNLLIVSGHVDPQLSTDEEEREQIQFMHELMQKYRLDEKMRWLGMHLNKDFAGELYRFVADSHGAFVQPALFEAFGLTVIEAMASGLPTFATRYGGPSEIIVDGVSGFQIDPNHGEQAAVYMIEFFQRCRKEPDYWEKISEGSLLRVEERYTWRLYAERMMTLSRIYGFWKYVTHLERDETRRYLEMLYSVEYRNRVAGMTG